VQIVGMQNLSRSRSHFDLRLCHKRFIEELDQDGRLLLRTQGWHLFDGSGCGILNASHYLMLTSNVLSLFSYIVLCRNREVTEDFYSSAVMRPSTELWI